VKTAPANEEAHPASVATDRAAHDESAEAGAATTTATDHDRPGIMTAAAKTAHASHEDEAAATATITKTGATHHEVPAAAHQHPADLADPTSHHVSREADPSRPRPRRATSSRKRRRPMLR
jgi:hypothetical protein